MANLTEAATWSAGVYQIETTDAVIGGPGGISNLQGQALANRTTYLKGQVEALDAAKAPLASPALTGTPTAPTAAAGTSTTQLATTAFVGAAVSEATVPQATESLSGKVELATAAETQAGADSTRAVHPAGLKSALDLKAPLASPTFTGTPAAPTAGAGTSTAQIASTAFVGAAIAAAVPAGTVMAFAGAAAPAGWLICDGSSLSKTTYATLYGAIGDLYGSASTTFKVPDYRGVFLRGLDAGAGIDADRVLGARQKGSLIAWDLGTTATQTCGINTTDGAASQVAMGADAYSTANYSGVSIRSVGGAGLSALPGTTGKYSGAVRPINDAVNYCIKY